MIQTLLTQPVTIKTTSSGSPPTDSYNIWKYGFQGITHNFATAGAGGIHTSADVLKPAYDKAFQAECAKLGIATTAEQAVPKEIVAGIAGRTEAPNRAAFTCVRTGDRIVFTFSETAANTPGKLTVYNLQGKLLASVPIETGATKVAWRPAATAKNSVLLFKYDAASGISLVKPVMK